MKHFVIIILTLFPCLIHAQIFNHPGLLQSREDLDRMKTAVAEKQEPIYSGYQVFMQNPASQAKYKMQGPMAMVGRNPTVGQATYDNDANAAYQHAIMWVITGEKKYADVAIKIINAWSATLKSITGRDAVLMAGLGPFKMVNAAEIIRYTNAGWSGEAIQQTENHFKEVIYPVLKDFAPFANGNWDAAAIKTVMAIGIFCNDQAIYERALRYYVNGCGNGRITNYIIGETGQIQESGRDQGHAQLGIALLGDCCEMAWHQGLDLYGYDNNRLLKGFEYIAKYNLGNDVPFAHVLDRTGKYEQFKPATKARGDLRAVYEQIYNHYVNRMGLTAPFTKQAAEKIRPEGPGKPSADHPGYGTLLYTRPAGSATVHNPRAAPGGIIASGSNQQITLSWIATLGAETYSVKRATKSDGPYTTIAKGIFNCGYIDKQVSPGVVYYYTLTATSAKGESPNTLAVSVAAGVPLNWQQQAIGGNSAMNKANFDGNGFSIEALGSGLGNTQDSCLFVFQSLNGDGAITARINPEPSSQFSSMGLMMREAIAPDAAYASLMLYPGKTNSVEAPAWHLRLMSRAKEGGVTTVGATGQPLVEPAVSHGRLTGYCWVCLQRKGSTFTAFGSYDGNNWTPIGSINLLLDKEILVGIPVASGMRSSTTVQIDNVSVTNN
ncbi:hypothetical protein A4H97_31385 [Niastella yeongjuensis]|uniref:Alginate lyase domain-containing protein n=1 Tax=Niastella yeongjuensis TaxID=354355 RepID=A0A1V9EK85_9BACT|nr:alginate lyase family protein [Niastella yeongjuensis]OQP46265.1 hypothetical protein A4H97_31385 [Niastella yeongjuensis]SEP46276.1 Protein of unknown function [Niastella yeongjuensis]